MDKFVASLVRDVEDELRDRGFGPTSPMTKTDLQRAIYASLLSARIEIIDIDSSTNTVTMAIRPPRLSTEIQLSFIADANAV